MSQPQPSQVRPEQRQRSGTQSAELYVGVADVADVADALPAADVCCYRSEAFAEDLPPPESTASKTGAVAPAAARRLWSGFGSWRLASSLTGLGLALFFGVRGD
jgi:hypothetical protein